MLKHFREYFASLALIAIWKGKLDTPVRFSFSTQNKRSGIVQVISDRLLETTKMAFLLTRYQPNRLFCMIVLQRRVYFKRHKHLKPLKKKKKIFPGQMAKISGDKLQFVAEDFIKIWFIYQNNFIKTKSGHFINL